MPSRRLEVRRETNRRWRENNRDRVRELGRDAYYRDPVAWNARALRWQTENRDKRNALAAKRRAQKLNATPAWADLARIRQIYTAAKGMTELLGEPWHVDHVLPLCGDTVSGLHVHENLQILPGRENVKKGNKFCTLEFGTS